MEVLKLLIEMVKDLPQMALWAIVIFFLYKVVVIGSIYGVIRFSITKICNLITTINTNRKEKELKHIELINSFSAKYSEELKKFHDEVMEFLNKKEFTEAEKKALRESMIRQQAGMASWGQQLGQQIGSARKQQMASPFNPGF